MKKILLLIFSLTVFFFFTGLSFAQQNPTPTPTPSQAPSKIEYTLPYPGILPDNPLYFFKNLRDKLIDIFIADPFKKVEFSILQADKKLNAGVYLVQKGEEKWELAEKTILDSNKHYQDAFNKIKDAKEQGADAKTLNQKLKDSLIKRMEVLEELSLKTKGDISEKLKQEKENTKKLLDSANSLVPQE